MHEAVDHTMRVLVAEDEQILRSWWRPVCGAGFAVDTVYSSRGCWCWRAANGGWRRASARRST
ncbi:hypothetical protein [Streptomyces atroolivaceus]|uniref:hypothetical protein n=1 Tax=Streptomyces atroolivaceus TaxID=66869 RepID=UPI00378BB359